MIKLKYRRIHNLIPDFVSTPWLGSSLHNSKLVNGINNANYIWTDIEETDQTEIYYDIFFSFEKDKIIDILNKEEPNRIVMVFFKMSDMDKSKWVEDLPEKHKSYLALYPGFNGLDSNRRRVIYLIDSFNKDYINVSHEIVKEEREKKLNRILYGIKPI